MASLSAQDIALLNLIAKTEAVRGKDPYMSLYPGTIEQSLVQMTLAEVLKFQQMRIDKGFKSSACGRYQIIRKTLKECIGYLGVDPLTTLFSPDIQDALIIKRLEVVRSYRKWLANDENVPTHKFMVKLAQEFASFPVPYDMKGAFRSVQKGETYYAGDGLNKAFHDPDALFTMLEDIKSGVPGTGKEISYAASSPNTAKPKYGTSTKQRALSILGGPKVGDVLGGNAGDRRLPAKKIVPPVNPYNYSNPRPFDTRYDFRTGRYVYDTLVHKLDPLAKDPHSSYAVGESNSEILNVGKVPENVNVPTYGDSPPEIDPLQLLTNPEQALQSALSNVINDVDLDNILSGNAPSIDIPDEFDFLSDFPDLSEMFDSVKENIVNSDLVDQVTSQIVSIEKSAYDSINELSDNLSSLADNLVTAVSNTASSISKQFPTFNNE